MFYFQFIFLSKIATSDKHSPNLNDKKREILLTMSLLSLISHVERVGYMNGNKSWRTFIRFNLPQFDDLSFSVESDSYQLVDVAISIVGL